MKIYLAAPLFSQMQRVWNRTLATRAAELFPEGEWVLPQDFRLDGKFNDVRHYGALFQKCLAEISAAGVVVAVLDGAEADSGVAFEMGYAHAQGIPVVGLRTDYRPGADQGMNLMCARACRFLVREFSFSEDVGLIAAAIVRRLRRLRGKA